MKASYVIGDRCITDDALQQEISRFDAVITHSSRILVHARHPLSLIIALHLGQQKSHALFVCPSHFSLSDVKNIVAQHRIHFVFNGGGKEAVHVEVSSGVALSGAVSPGLFIFTSGTTGAPKLAQHSWDSITAASEFVSDQLSEKNWLMTYVPTGYAGLQVFFAAMRHKGTLAYVVEGGFEAYCKSIIQNKVSIISATPTFWRLLRNAWPSEVTPPRLAQATVGGEIVTQDVLDLIDGFFHPRQLTHIYASTEVGSAIVVSDRLAGFPERYFESGRRVCLRCDKNEVLEVNSPSRMTMYLAQPGLEDDEGWISTGDIVEKRADRYYFIGRSDGRINVGGSKVLPEEVEAVLLSLDAVQDCIVYEKKNPMVGALLASDIVPKTRGVVSIAELKRVLLSSLPSYKVPQYIRFVDTIEISGNGKKIRK